MTNDPICPERGIPQSECPWFCRHGDLTDAVICQCGEPVGHAEHCEHCCGCGAASEHEHMAKVEHLRRCPICNTRFDQWNALEMARKADAAERRAEEAEYHVEQLRDARDRAERRLERVEALAEQWREDYPGPLAACNRTSDEWWRDLREHLENGGDHV